MHTDPPSIVLHGQNMLGNREVERLRQRAPVAPCMGQARPQGLEKA